MPRLELTIVDDDIDLSLSDQNGVISVSADQNQFATLYIDAITGVRVTSPELIAGGLISQDENNLIHKGNDGLLKVEDDTTDYLAYYLLAKG